MKRRIALITAIFMLLFSLPTFAQTTTQSSIAPVTFSDMPAKDSSYYPAIEYAVNKKLINGSNGKINPDMTITKAEAVTILSRATAFGLETADLSNVSDVKKEDWYYPVMAQGVKAGIIAPDASGKLNPTETMSALPAWSMITKAFNNSSLTVTIPNPNQAVTRAEFLNWVYMFVQANTTTQAPTEAPTEATTEELSYSQLEALKAQEAMQVALGIKSDGTYYNVTTAYKDQSQTDWYDGGTPSRREPSGGGSSNRPPVVDDDEDETQAPTEAPTEPPTEDETQAPTEYPTEAPQEPETAEPTYGDYDGPIDNDKDNVVDDPFDDGWRPPGWVGDEDDDDNNSGGWDAEDEDFNINDADDPDYQPETEKPTEPETDPPTSGDTEPETDAPTGDSTETETDVPTGDRAETETDAPTAGDTEPETDAPTSGDTETETDAPTGDSTEQPPILPDNKEEDEGEKGGSENDDATLPDKEEEEDEPPMVETL